MNKDTDTDLLLQRIATHLMINASFINNLGLYHGKMGIVLFFAHYAKYTNKTIFEDFMEDLLNQIYMNVDEDLTLNIENGLCGIGWGLIYLLKNKFVDGDPCIILKDIDSKILAVNFLYNNTLGLYTYITERIAIGDYDPGLKEIKFLINKEENKNIDTFISPYFNVNENVRKWELGLYNGCAGFGIKKILQ